jgi:hypothetical protein
MSENERRTEKRFRIGQMIGYYPSREEYIWAEGIDLSLGGLSCISKAPISPLTQLFVMITIPGPEGDKQVRCEGYVTHSHFEEGMCHFGVRIQRIDEGDKPLLDRYLEALDGEKGAASPSVPD